MTVEICMYMLKRIYNVSDGDHIAFFVLSAEDRRHIILLSKSN